MMNSFNLTVWKSIINNLSFLENAKNPNLSILATESISWPSLGQGESEFALLTINPARLRFKHFYKLVSEQKCSSVIHIVLKSSGFVSTPRETRVMFWNRDVPMSHPTLRPKIKSDEAILSSFLQNREKHRVDGRQKASPCASGQRFEQQTDRNFS